MVYYHILYQLSWKLSKTLLKTNATFFLLLVARVKVMVTFATLSRWDFHDLATTFSSRDFTENLTILSTIQKNLLYRTKI